MHARVCVYVCFYVHRTQSFWSTLHTEWPKINGLSFVFISFSDLLTIPALLLLLFSFFFLPPLALSLYSLPYLALCLELQQHFFSRLPVCLASHLFLLKIDRAHIQFTEFCCCCNSGLFISSLYLCHSSNFQSIYTVRMSLFLHLLFKICVCVCAYCAFDWTVCVRVFVEKEILYDRILCCYVSWYNRIKQINTFGAREEVEKSGEFRYNSAQWKALCQHTNTYTLATDETVHLVRMIQANNASTRKRAISCKWTPKRETIKSIAHFSPYKSVSFTNTQHQHQQTHQSFPIRNWIRNVCRVYCWSYTKSLVFFITPTQFRMFAVIFGICDTIKSDVMVLFAGCFFSSSLHFTRCIHLNAQINKRKYTNQFGERENRKKKKTV